MKPWMERRRMAAHCLAMMETCEIWYKTPRTEEREAIKAKLLAIATEPDPTPCTPITALTARCRNA